MKYTVVILIESLTYVPQEQLISYVIVKTTDSGEYIVILHTWTVTSSPISDEHF